MTYPRQNVIDNLPKACPCCKSLISRLSVAYENKDGGDSYSREAEYQCGAIWKAKTCDGFSDGFSGPATAKTDCPISHKTAMKLQRELRRARREKAICDRDHGGPGCDDPDCYLNREKCKPAPPPVDPQELASTLQRFLAWVRLTRA